LPTNCGGDVTETWTAVVCGNTVSTSRTITISPATLPTMTTPAAVTVACGSVPVSSIIVFSNGLTGGCEISGTSNTSTFSVTTPGFCNGKVTETWTATDTCGRILNSVSRIITIEDTTAPVLSGQGGAITITSPAVPVFTAPTAIDACDSAPAITYTDASVAVSGGSIITRTWTATDACGNVSATVSQAITVLNASVVSIVATTSNAAEPSTNGLFTINLSNPVATPTVVTYAVTGTATNGTDYVNITNTITIPANTTSVAIPVTVTDDNVLEGSESVSITLMSTNNGVTVSTTVANATATVTIADNEVATPSVSIQANNDDAGTIDPVIGIKGFLNVLTNDTLNGLQINPSDVTLTLTPNANFTVGANGLLDALVNIPGGVYTVLYTICEKANPNNCSSTTVNVFVARPSIALVKTAHFNDENRDGYANVGETITYSFEITNTGNTALTTITVSDPLPGVVMTGGAITLAIGESNTTNFKGAYVITQADINLGSISNQATVYGTSPNGRVVEDKSDNTNLIDDNPTVLPVETCVIKVFNAVSPDGSGQNNRFYIEGLECYPENSIEIYNRWGVLVFEKEHYNNEDGAFRGTSEGRVTVDKSQELPVGTYFYILKYKDTGSNAIEKSGYLYLNRK
jgi:uncharacterized repeat protein (TIGR01451 family)/gliding motility-associated-like protein